MQVGFLWADLALLGSLGVILGWRRLQEADREDVVTGLLFVLAFGVRLIISPHTLVHENAHGYEYLRSAFTLDGYFYHGAGYYAFHYLFAGGRPEGVFVVNALLGAGSALLLVPLGRRLTNSREAAWLASCAYACWPMVLRISASESMFPLAVFFGLLAWLAWLRAWDTGRAAWFVFAAGALAFGVQVRPLMALWPLVLLLSLPLCRGWSIRLRTCWPWISLGWFLILTGGWLVFRIQLLGNEGIPDFMRLAPADVARGWMSTHNLFARFDWTPAPAWLLAPCGLLVLFARRPRATPALAGGFVILAWAVMGIRTGESTSLRLQSLLVPFFLLWVGAGASFLADRAGHRLRTPALVLVGLVLCVLALARTPRIRALSNPQQEYAFLERTVPGLPPDCAVVTADRFLAKGVVSTEFPDWWTGRRPVVQQSDYLANPEQLAGWPCILYYRGLSCHCFTYQELRSLPPDGIRPECKRIHERFDLDPLVEEGFPNRPCTSFRVPADSIRLGFYQLTRPAFGSQAP